MLLNSGLASDLQSNRIELHSFNQQLHAQGITTLPDGIGACQLFTSLASPNAQVAVAGILCGFVAQRSQRLTRALPEQGAEFFITT